MALRSDGALARPGAEVCHETSRVVSKLVLLRLARKVSELIASWTSAR